MTTTTDVRADNVPSFELHHRLALALEWAGVTPAEMADELGLHVNSVHNYSAGRRDPKRAIIAVWAMRTGVPIDWLLTGRVPDMDDNGPHGGGVDTGVNTLRYGLSEVPPPWSRHLIAVAA